MKRDQPGSRNKLNFIGDFNELNFGLIHQRLHQLWTIVKFLRACISF